MQTFHEIRQPHLDGPTVVTVGNFDGVHRGHQALLDKLQEAAAQIAAPSGRTAATALVTFDPHPITVLRPGLPNLLLTTPRERLELAAAQGIDIGVIQPFTRETAQLTAQEFVQLLRQHLGMVALVVGPDFALGRHRSGDIATLQALGSELGYAVVVLDPIDAEDGPVRSSRVRDLLQSGDVAAAAQLLGRSYRVSGLVERGDQRGRTVGIPTANVQPPPDKLLPADGVYATRTLIASFDRVHVFESVTNIGVRPTVDGLHRRVEAHILDFPPPGQIDDLYGEQIALEFMARLRGEKRFANVGELVKQIHADVAQARLIFAERGIRQEV